MTRFYVVKNDANFTAASILLKVHNIGFNVDENGRFWVDKCDEPLVVELFDKRKIEYKII